MIFRGGQGVRCLGMLGRTTVGKAGGDGGLGWADCWRWRRPFPVLLPRFRVPRPIRKRSVSTTTCCPTTTASSAPLATTAIASLSKWDCASPSSSTLWVDDPLPSNPLLLRYYCDPAFHLPRYLIIYRQINYLFLSNIIIIITPFLPFLSRTHIRNTFDATRIERRTLGVCYSHRIERFVERWERTISPYGQSRSSALLAVR